MGFLAGSRWLFGGAVFLASFLLFLVEPMAAKQLLPVFGGSAAVWVTCLVFFQAALLAAYLYAHWLAGAGPARAELSGKLAVFHIVLLLVAAAVAAVYAFHASEGSGELGSPVLAIFAALGVSIGLPFLILGATSPLLTVWMARVGTGGVPYRLYALSNLASLLALAVYPTLIEPNFTLRAQRVAWCCGFALFALLSAVLTWRTKGIAGEPEREIEKNEAPAASAWRKTLWVLLPMGAAAQLSAVTSYLTANIAPIPLLWVLPLGVYLITLILAFQFPKIAPRWLVMRMLVVMLAGLGYMLMQVDTTLPIRVGIGFFLLELFVAGLFCHAEAFRLRPERSGETTLFYLLFAAGGALGSFLIGILAPLVFRFNFDLAVVFLITALLALAVNWGSGWAASWGPRLLWGTASVLLLLLVVFIQRAYEHNTPVAVRNFYGSLRVKRMIGYPAAETLTLTNGNIQHGTQILSQELRRVPTTYYAEDSGVGVALKNCCAGRTKSVGVIGLGAGTLAAYGAVGDRFRFYEINPAVAPIARNVFWYMRDSAATIDVVEGDARSSLAGEPPQGFDVLVVDAFSGDAIPLHLLTAEAMGVYRKHLAPGGMLAFHISNQHVDLEPEVVRLAESAGMSLMRVESPINEERGEFSATWMLVTDNDGFFLEPGVAGRVRKARGSEKVRLWTDDYSSLLPVLRW
jgi:spermidine synthase